MLESTEFARVRQAACRARIQIHQFSMKRVQRLLGGGIIFQGVGRVELFRHPWFLLLGQMIQHVSALQSRALVRWPQERGFRFSGGFRPRRCLSPFHSSVPSTPSSNRT